MTSRQDDQIARALQRFGLERDRMRAALARAAGISGTDLDALEHLEADGPLTQRELGDRLALTSGAVTMLVDRLESLGWVRRTPHPDDRRKLLVGLTEQAAEQLPPALVEYHRRIRAIERRTPAADRPALTALLTAAADAAARATAGLQP